MKRPSIAIVAAACAVLISPADLPGFQSAQQKSGKTVSKGGGKDGQQAQGQGEFTLDFLIGFSTKDARRLASEHGLGGQKPLPPGILKNLARGKPLPPGIAKKTLPTPFVKQLPAHDGYRWQMAGTDLVLISTLDNVVREIARDVFK